jgi:hypothetical protein
MICSPVVDCEINVNAESDSDQSHDESSPHDVLAFDDGLDDVSNF